MSACVNGVADCEGGRYQVCKHGTDDVGRISRSQIAEKVIPENITLTTLTTVCDD